jgi:hypothetical protein
MGPNHGLGICFNATSIMLFILGEKIFIDVAGKNFFYNSIAQSLKYIEQNIKTDIRVENRTANRLAKDFLLVHMGKDLKGLRVPKHLECY